MVTLAGMVDQALLMVLEVDRELVVGLPAHVAVEALPRPVTDRAMVEVDLPTEDAALILVIGLSPRSNLLPRSRANPLGVATVVEVVMIPTLAMMVTKGMNQWMISLPEPMSLALSGKGR